MTDEFDDERQELLSEIDTIIEKQNGLGFKTITTALSTLILVVAVTAPKIYLSASIYYMSLETDSLYSNYRALREENRFLEQKLEMLRYQNSILKTLE